MDRVVVASRYILAVFLLGLLVGLALYAVRFLGKLWSMAATLTTSSDSDMLLGLLYLLDSALVASLVVTVALSTYDTLVSRLGRRRTQGMGSLLDGADQGTLKTKLATAIIAISSIHLLQVFMKADSFDDREITWGLIIQGLFLAGAVCLAAVDWIEAKTKAARKKMAMAPDTHEEGAGTAGAA
jgi:uncharacterized protein (TIGR00645 family)